MSVVVQTPYNAHLANGITTLFGFDFQLLDEGDLRVSLDGVVQMGGFTISGLGVQAGGGVTFALAPANGVLVELERRIPLARSTDYQKNGDLPEELLDNDFDRLWQAIQDQAYFTSLTIVLPPGDAVAPMILPTVSERASKFFAFNAMGEAIASLGVPEVPATPFAASLLDDADAAEARTTLGAAASGANSDITSLSGLTTPLSKTQGGTGVNDGSTLTPPGAILFFPATVAPVGWLKANGASLLRASYPDLWAYAQASGNLVAQGSKAAGNFGTGDDSTTFTLPDGRAEFVRGLDDGRGIDTGRAVGSAQAGQMPAHTHTTPVILNSAIGAFGDPISGDGAGTVNKVTSSAGGTNNASENRPRNVAWLVCIKY